MISVKMTCLMPSYKSISILIDKTGQTFDRFWYCQSTLPPLSHHSISSYLLNFYVQCDSLILFRNSYPSWLFFVTTTNHIYITSSISHHKCKSHFHLFLMMHVISMLSCGVLCGNIVHAFNDTPAPVIFPIGMNLVSMFSGRNQI